MTKPDTGFLSFAMLNGSVLSADGLQISPLGSGFMFGEGVFETVRVQNSRAKWLPAHQARLSDSLHFLEATPLASLDQLHDRCDKVIAANSLVEGSLKIVVFREITGWSEIILARAATYSAIHYEKGFRLQSARCDQRIDPVHALKSLNYFGNLRAKRRAVAAGFDEALFVDPSERVLEGATTNVFIVKDGKVSTPLLSDRILPGVTRARVLRSFEFPAENERDVTFDELLSAEEVFVTNALLEIMPVAFVDTTAYNLAENAVTRSLMALLRERL